MKPALNLGVVHHLANLSENSLPDCSIRLSTQLAQIVNQVNARQAGAAVLKSPTQAWPRNLVLLPDAPQLPTPTVTW